jgi:hypothetical protein
MSPFTSSKYPIKMHFPFLGCNVFLSHHECESMLHYQTYKTILFGLILLHSSFDVIVFKAFVGVHITM